MSPLIFSPKSKNQAKNTAYRSASTQLRGRALAFMTSRPKHRQLNNHPIQSLSGSVNLALPYHAYKNFLGSLWADEYYKHTN
jgi:hypothetical protein